MGILNPTIDDAIASISKGITKLDTVVKAAGETASDARARIAAEDARMKAAQADIERASRIKKKLEELVS